MAMLFLVDATQLVHVYWHRNPDPPDVVERFLTRLERLHEWSQWHRKNGHCVCVFDNPRPTYRASLMPEYKADRTKHEDIDETIAHAVEAMRNSSDWKSFVAPDGYEADDAMASLCKSYEGRIVIHSSDRDMYQCLREDGSVVIAKNSYVDPVNHAFKFDWWTYKNFVDKLGFTPDLYADYQCLVGSKNLPGAQGIGEKNAKIIVSECCRTGIGIEEYDPTDFSDHQIEGWFGFLDQLETYRQCMTLCCDLPVEHLIEGLEA